MSEKSNCSEKDTPTKGESRTIALKGKKLLSEKQLDKESFEKDSPKSPITIISAEPVTEKMIKEL